MNGIVQIGTRGTYGIETVSVMVARIVRWCNQSSERGTIIYLDDGSTVTTFENHAEVTAKIGAALTPLPPPPEGLKHG